MSASIAPDVLNQMIIDSSMSGLWVVDPAFRILAWNPALENLTGVSSAHALGQPLLEVLPELWSYNMERLLHQALQGQKIIAPDLRCALFSRNGTPVWVGLRLMPLRSATGSIVGVIGTVTEITERKAAEERLARSEEHFRSLVELAVDAIFLQDSQGNILTANARAAEITGYSTEELRRMKMADLFAAEEHARKPLRPDLLRSGGVVTFQRRLTRKDGRVIPIEMNSRMMPDGAIQTFLRDISEREQATEAVREAQHRFDSFIQTNPHIAAQGMDRNGVILHWNEASSRLYHLHAEQVLGQRLQDILFDGAEAEEFEHLLELAWLTKQPSPAREWKVVPPDGRVRWVYSALFPVLQHGSVTEVFCIDVDITERRRAEESLQQSEAKLRSVFNTIPYPIFAKDINLRYNECNRAFMEFLGMGRDQIIGRTVFDLMPEEQARIQNQADLNLLEQGGCQTSETTLSSKGGVTHDVILHQGVFLTSDGRPAGMVGVLVDITRRKRDEAAIRQSEASYRRLYETMRDAFVTTDLSGRIGEFNQGFVALLGYTPDELRQLSYRDITPEKWHAMEESIVKEQVLQRGYSEVYEKEYRKKDGTVFPVELRTILSRDEQGQPDGMWAIVRDVSDRKRSEKALNTIASRFRSLFNNMAEGVALHQTLLDANGRPVNYRILDVNPAYEKILGLRRNSVLGRLATEVYQTETPPYLERFTQVGETSQPDQFETYFPPMQRHFEISVVPTGPHRWATIFTDITERKRAAEQLRQTNEQLEATLNALPDLLFEVDREGRILAYRTPHETALYAPAVDFLGRKVSEVLPPNASQAIESAIQQAVQKGVHHGTQYFLQMPQGTRWYELSVASKGDPTAPHARFITLARDVTDRKRTEADLHLKNHAIDSSATAIAMADTIGRLNYVNPAFLQLWGYGHPDEVLGRSVVEFWQTPSDAAHVVERLMEAGLWIGELEATRKDGSRFIAHLTANLVRDENGRPVCMMGSFTNISDRKELEARLRQSQKLEGVGQLAGGVAHDFNNILTVILGNASVLKMETGLRGESAELLREISEAGERAANLTRQLLAFSRKQPMKVVPLDLNEVVAGLTKLLRRMIGEDIDLECRYSSNALPIVGDSVMLGQVLMNLAVNARDAMPHGGRLFLSTEAVRLGPDQVAQQPTAREGRFVRLDVRDTGSGIAPEVLPHVFEPFFTTKEVGKGTGLGLATAYGIVQQHGGWIQIASAPGDGTTFSIYLPLDETASAAHLGPNDAPKVARGKETILVVEDEPGVRALARLCLQRYGYTVIEAGNGPEALAAWQRSEGKIDLLLTDIVMPGGMSGRELAETLWRQSAGLRVLFSSGYSTDLSEQADLGPQARFLPKPYEIEVLARTVRDFLDGKSTAW